MAVYRFKVSFEEHEDISREIEIRSDQTFEDLHNAIQQAVGFDASQPASFYMSNDHWIKGQEISLKPREKRGNDKNVLMEDAVLSDWMIDPHQKIYYLFDYENQWTFYVELYRIFPSADVRKNYPVCVKVNGDAPKQRVVIAPLKTNELEIEEPELLTDDYEEKEENEDGEETVIDEAEADEITDEGIMPGEASSEEDV